MVFSVIGVSFTYLALAQYYLKAIGKY